MTPHSMSFKDVLSDHSVRRLWIAQLISVFGDFLALFAVVSLVTFQLHGTPTQVAMILVSFLFPMAFLSPIAGVFVDKWNVKRTMILSDVIRGLLMLVLVFVRDVNAIYVIFFFLAVVSTFFIPAQSVTVRTIAPAAGLMAVNGLMSQAIQGSQIIAPSISGILVEWFGANACFLFDAVSFFASAGLVATLTINRERKPAAAATSAVSSLLQGFRFIFTHSVIGFVILAMASGMFAVRCFGSLLSIYVRDLLASTSALFGVLNTLIGVGMIVGTQFLHRFARRVPQQFIVIYGLTGMGVAVLITAIFGRISTTAIGMLGLGMGAACIMVPSQTLVQQETPPEMLGRVSSSLMSLMAFSQVTAMIVAGPVAEKLGIRTLYFGSAVMLMVIGMIGFGKLGRHKAGDAAAA
jgi:DHA3 family macrolide efflux protein-like MFS transporter